MYRKNILKGLGIMFLVIGITGIILPLLPTTPFLLLATACFAKSSPTLHDRLINNRVFGKYIRNYQENKGIPLRVKITSLFFLWLSVGFTLYFILENNYVRTVVIAILIGITVHILRMKTLKEPAKMDEEPSSEKH